MTILYRIKPVDKKSVEAFYDVYSKDEQGNIRSWSVTEMYRWGQGFVENEDELPHSDDKYHTVDPQLGWGCELDDLCAVDFEFDDSFTEEEKEHIEQLKSALDTGQKPESELYNLNTDKEELYKSKIKMLEEALSQARDREREHIEREQWQRNHIEKLTDTIKMLEPPKPQEKPKGFFSRFFGK